MRRTLRLSACSAVAAICSTAANAQNWQIIPRATVTATHSDNIERLANDRAQSDWLTELTPGIRIAYPGARANIFLDYQRRSSFYADQSRLNNSQNQLNSFAKLTLADKWLFLDSQANITQQNRSPFESSQADTTNSINRNRVETTTYQIAPHVRLLAGTFADVQARLNQTETRTDDAAFPKTRLSEWVARAKSPNPSAKFNWSIDATALTIRNNLLGTRDDARARGTLIYAIEPQLRLSLIGGYENTDYASDIRRKNEIYGAGIEWAPSPRTQVAGVVEHRFFGEGYIAQATHRTPLTAWRLRSSRDISVLPAQLAAIDPGSVYSVMFDLLASAIPDPVARAEAVQSRLRQTGIGAGGLSGGFLSTRPFLATNHEASFAFLGSINTFALTYLDRKQRSVGASITGSSGAFVNEDVAQRSFTTSWSRRLSPLTSLTVNAARLESRSTTSSRLESTQDSVGISLTRRVSPKTNASVGIRRVEFDSTVSASYDENSAFVTITHQF